MLVKLNFCRSIHRSNVHSQSQSLPQLNAPVQQTIPLSRVHDSPSHPHGPSKANPPGDSKQQFSLKPPVHTALLLYPEPAPDSTNTSNTSTSIEALKTSQRIHKWSAPPPPHFPDDQLFAPAALYGPICTFTRHVRDNESRYGFVLCVFIRP